ncbi:MAG: hypothetical protein AB8E82_04515 [Aureispira sp.]
MINATEQAYLSKLLAESEQQFRYYLTMAAVIIILSWGLYFALRRPGAMIIALILSVGLWYYPWRYFQKAQLLRLDLEEQEKITLTTTIYDKKISKINRLQPYYYCYTDEEDFEVNQALYNSIQVPQQATITYAPNSGTILHIAPANAPS